MKSLESNQTNPFTLDVDLDSDAEDEKACRDLQKISKKLIHFTIKNLYFYLLKWFSFLLQI